MSKTSVAAPSTQIAARVATLVLMLVVALEAGGLYALPQGSDATEMAATDDGLAVAQAHPRAARVEISIVAQADAPAR